MEKILTKAKPYIPKSIFNFFNPAYHASMALASAVFYRFPSRKIKIIAVTGTKGKSSTVELTSAILEKAGYKTALSNTIRFKIGDQSRDNLYKMSMPGRGFMQKFIRQAVNAKCDYAILEMTSQGALAYRHRFINIDTFVVTNVSPEHVEAHGSYENYVASKMAIGHQFERSKSKKKNVWKEKKSKTIQKTLIVNGDDAEAKKFLTLHADKKIEYKIAEAKPYSLLENGLEFSYNGERIQSHLSGLFNIYNILASIKATENEKNVTLETIISTLRKFTGIKGRMERIKAGQDFTVIVDYAHTVDSLKKVYEVFANAHSVKKPRLIGVLGGTGGGRDRAKRKEMGKIAAQYCDYVVLTNEDPYDENPMQIINDVKAGVDEVWQSEKTTTKNPTIILDRRLAIRDAIAHAKTGDVVIITGKGTDPYIMGAHGNNIPWSDARITREELLQFR